MLKLEPMVTNSGAVMLVTVSSGETYGTTVISLAVVLKPVPLYSGTAPVAEPPMPVSRDEMVLSEYPLAP